jgi:predicted peptidase
MKLLLLVALLAQVPASSFGRIQNRTMPVDGVGTVTYGISVPTDYRAGEARPLILVLHPGGDRRAYYGSLFMRQIVLEALGNLRAIAVAPDCPARAWGDPKCDQGVMALLRKVQEEYTIDRRRVLVTGFSMGGRGTWFMASHHPDLFTAAIAMAASTGDEPIDRLAKMPTYVIHSRDDQVVPFEPAAKNARELEKLGRPIRFEELSGIGHFEMGGYIDSLRRAGRWIEERWAK